jgi:hypothetical protein
MESSRVVATAVSRDCICEKIEANHSLHLVSLQGVCPHDCDGVVQEVLCSHSYSGCFYTRRLLCLSIRLVIPRAYLQMICTMDGGTCRVNVPSREQTEVGRAPPRCAISAV